MIEPQFAQANPARDRDALLLLNVEYLSWVSAGIYETFGLSVEDLTGTSIPEYVAGVLDKVCGDPPPTGAFYLITCDGDLAGMGGLRRLGDGVAEVKRIYVRPGHRGKRLGEAILKRLLEDAAAFGYRKVVLDTGPFMQSAQRLYESVGFTDCAPYAGVEVPAALHHGWRFMERSL